MGCVGCVAACVCVIVCVIVCDCVCDCVCDEVCRCGAVAWMKGCQWLVHAH